MKSAVLKKLGDTPLFGEFKNPQPSEGEVIMKVKAAALKNIDKLLASGKHYASYKQVPVVVGLDGAGVLADGTAVYAKGITGTLAEEAVVSEKGTIPLPAGIDWSIAAALPNAAMGSYLPLKVKGEMKQGDVVLINGGTGVTGKLAIQLAKYYGAAKVIVSGHVKGKEEELQTLGADELIDTQQEDQALITQLQQSEKSAPINMVIDYLWGHPTELIIDSLFRAGGVAPNHNTKIVSVGALAGDEIYLSSNNLRSGKTEIIGAGLGSYTPKQFQHFNKEVIPEIFHLAVENKIKIDLVKEKLSDIEEVWNKNGKGKRTVIEI